MHPTSEDVRPCKRRSWRRGMSAQTDVYKEKPIMAKYFCKFGITPIPPVVDLSHSHSFSLDATPLESGVMHLVSRFGLLSLGYDLLCTPQIMLCEG
jgi:hypothetical protein